MKAYLLFFFIVFGWSVTAPAQPILSGSETRSDRDRPGPWDHDVLVDRLRADGTTEKLATFERAVVPTLARLNNGRIIAAFQHFPADDDRNFDSVALRFSDDEGRAWGKPQPIVVENMAGGLARPFDPTLVPLPDGRVRIYFTSNRNAHFQRSTPAIYSAVSTNAIYYVFEPGARFAVEGRIIIDCAAALHNGTFHLIIPDNGTAGDFISGQDRHELPRGGTGYHAISQDGLKFERVADVRLSNRRNRWLGNMQSDGGNLVFFGTGERGVSSATSFDGDKWELSEEPIRAQGDDPGAVKLKDGNWLIAITGPPRAGNPSALRFQPGGAQLPREGFAPTDTPRGHDLKGDVQPQLFAPRNPSHPEGGPRPDGGLLSHNVASATSKDGLTWTRDEGFRLTSASVPCAINDRDQRVLLYFVQPLTQPGKPETVACAVSSDGLKFELSREFQIAGLSVRKAVDPSTLKDDAGKFRLYYLASDAPGDPASGANPHSIHLALSDDGLHFRESRPVFEYNDLVDPDVFHFNSQWFMYVFAKHATIVATSSDGRSFSYAREMSPCDWGTTAPLMLPDGRLRLYGFEQRVPRANPVRSFLSTDGLNWTAETGDRIKAGDDEQITDPFVVPWRGGFKMYFKTSAPDWPGATQPRPAHDSPRAQLPLDERAQGTFPLFDSRFVRIPSSVAGREGIAASIVIPRRARFNGGAPVIINVIGGVQSGGARGRPEYVGHGFVEVHFAFPGGGVGEERSGGVYDFRGPKCIRALADVIRFATGRIADSDGRHIGEVAQGMKVLTNNIGIVGSSHGGNTCGMAMALHGAEFPDLAWYASMESPYGEGAANVELGGRETGVNPAYDLKTGALDLSKLAWSAELSPGLARKPMLVTTRGLRGALFFDLDGDGRFDSEKDFPASAFFGDAGNGVKAWYSPRITAEAERRKLISDIRPRHIPTLAEAKEFWRHRDATGGIPSAVRNCTNLAVLVYANERDHVQADPAHTHILEQVEGFREAGARLMRLNPDRAYVERVRPSGPAFNRPLHFTDNPAGKTWTREDISEGVEPSALPLGIYMQAAVCELADRAQAKNWSVNLDAVLFADTPKPTGLGPAGRPPRPRTF